MALVIIDDEVWINEQDIARIEHPSRDEYQIYTKAGEKIKSNKWYVDDIIGSSRIVQLIPLDDTMGMMSEFKEKYNDRVWYKDRVDAIAVCADGNLRPVNYSQYFADFTFMDESLFEILTPSYYQECDYEYELDNCDKVGKEE